MNKPVRNSHLSSSLAGLLFCLGHYEQKWDKNGFVLDAAYNMCEQYHGNNDPAGLTNWCGTVHEGVPIALCTAMPPEFQGCY